MYRQILLHYDEFNMHTFYITDILESEFALLKEKGQDHFRFKETFMIIKALSTHLEELYAIFVTNNLVSMDKITDVNKMKFNNFQYLFQEIFNFKDTPKFGTDQLQLIFYLSCRICTKNIPGKRYMIKCLDFI